MTVHQVIDGKSTAADSTFEVIDPATGEPFAEAPDCSREQLEAAMDAAAAAWPSWSSDSADRPAVMRKAADAVRGVADDIAALLTSEQGKPLHEAKGEVLSVATKFEYFADLAPHEPVLHDDERRRVRVRRRSVGVVSAITPWNYPVGIAAIKLAPALRAGCTVVLKPSPFTPLATLALGRVLNEVLPPGVLNVVSGGDDLGAWMVAHPTPRKVSFTGSTSAGKAVARTAMADLKRVTLELGGNDPAILLDDFDADAYAERLFWGAFANNGQVCVAAKRVYAPRRLYGAVVDALTEYARTVRVGPGTSPGVQLGPLATRPQYDRVVELAASVVAEGGRYTTGGRPVDGEGYFFEPSIVCDLGDEARLVREEQFGPLLPILAYDDLDDAVRRANDSSFGLGASVWGIDLDRATAVAERIESGTVWINTHIAPAPDIPLSGMKQSGLGVENGIWGLEEYTELQLLHRDNRVPQALVKVVAAEGRE